MKYYPFRKRISQQIGIYNSFESIDSTMNVKQEKAIITILKNISPFLNVKLSYNISNGECLIRKDNDNLIMITSEINYSRIIYKINKNGVITKLLQDTFFLDMILINILYLLNIFLIFMKYINKYN